MIVKYNNYYYSGFFYKGIYRVDKTHYKDDFYVIESFAFQNFYHYRTFMHKLVEMGGEFIRKF